MHVGIDWVSTAIIVAAFAFAQVRAVSLRLRNGVLAAALLGVAGYRFATSKAAGVNGAVVLIAVALAGYYGYRAAKNR